MGSPSTTKTLVFDEHGAPEVKEVTTTPAEREDIEQTVAVMGGADWERWITSPRHLGTRPRRTERRRRTLEHRHRRHHRRTRRPRLVR
ncbi:hypothetical protein [Streptomyces sp. NPDC048272]|uniref:hypothetical protein n=1 Tax=Streptomyces sp. NPDC048272 TaxID=3154616 RepID=UPI0034183FFB